MTDALIVFLPRSVADQPVPWRRLGADGQVVQAGTLGDDGLLPDVAVRIAVVPGSQVAVRWLDLPAARPAQVAAAARWQMEQALGHDLEDAQVVAGQHRLGGRLPVAVVARPVLDGWLAWLEAAGLAGARLVPDCLCLVPQDGDMTLAHRAGGEIVIAGEHLSATIQSDWVPQFVADGQAREIEPALVLDALAVGSLASPLDLAPKPVAVRNGRGWRLAAMLAVAVLVSPLVLGLAATVRDDMAARKALSEAAERAIALDPALTGRDDALAQAERDLALAPPAGGQGRVLAAMAQALPAVSGAKLAEFDASGRQARGIVYLPSAESVESLREALAQRGLSLSQCEVSQEAGRTLCAFSVEVL